MRYDAGSHHAFVMLFSDVTGMMDVCPSPYGSVLLLCSRDSASALQCFNPFLCFTSKSNSSSANLHLSSLPPAPLSFASMSCFAASESVMIVNLLLYRYILNSLVDHIIASASNSHVEYAASCLDIARDAYAMTCSFPSMRCDSTAPNPWWHASVCSSNG